MTAPVLVTGAAGSLGTWLVERLSSAELSIRAFDLSSVDFSGLEGRDNIEIVRGNITDKRAVASCVEGVGAVVHLAALLPPVSEDDSGLTHGVNVGGTANIVRALEEINPKATLVFGSSVSTYGDTSSESSPIRVGHRQHATDAYAASKIAGEALVRSSSLRTVVLRMAGIAVPAFLEPPEVWPFTPGQRVEMVHRDDAVDALFEAVNVPEAWDKVFNISGGATWQLSGRDYASDFYGFLGAPVGDAVYRDTAGWMDWYDTEESQEVLRYQSRSYEHYCTEMKDLVRSLIAK